ncbi:MAG: 6-bladed beta-propeller [Gemmatimonadetes bacterium]|nr:6-bladed beta-propeller [Gemmatimonadota bacterium]
MRINPESRALLSLVFAGAISSCVTESAGPPPLRETLPNGALLVRHPDLPGIDAVGPDVSEAHVDLRFGSLDGADPNLLFGDIRGIQATRDGTIYVLDYQATEVRVFDSDGQYLRTIVRQGEGPGEITAANGIILSGDSLLWVHDHGKWRIVGVNLDGEQVRQFNKPVLSYGAIWDGVFDNLGRYWREESHSDEDWPYPPPEGWSTSTWREYHKYYDLSDGAVDSVYLGEHVSRSYYHHYRDSNGRLRFLEIDFLPYETAVVNPSGGFWHANTGAYRIVRTGEDGDTLVVIEAGLTAMPVTDEDREAYIEENVEDRPEARAAAEAVAAALPDVKPVLERMFVDDEGRLWVQRLTPPEVPAFFDMFSEDGDYLGSVRFAFTPAFSEFFWVQHGNIYTWVVDELDVQYVVRARLG